MDHDQNTTLAERNSTRRDASRSWSRTGQIGHVVIVASNKHDVESAIAAKIGSGSPTVRAILLPITANIKIINPEGITSVVD